MAVSQLRSCAESPVADPIRSDTALVCDLEDTAMLDAYFDGVLVQPVKALGAAPAEWREWAKVTEESELAAEPLQAGDAAGKGAL